MEVMKFAISIKQSIINVMHDYTEQPNNIISEQFHTNGTLYSYTVVKDGKPANGWSSKNITQLLHCRKKKAIVMTAYRKNKLS